MRISKLKPHLSLMLIAILFLLSSHCEAKDKTKGKFLFSKNGDFASVKTSAYTAKIRKEGSFVIDVKDTMKIGASLIQCWKHYQTFPQVKYLEATFFKDWNRNTVEICFKYFWNDGRVQEKLVFRPDSVAISYAYTPFIEKDTSRIIIMTQVLDPKKPSKTMKLIGMDRHLNNDGALFRFDTWAHLRKPNFRSLSVRNVGKHTVDFLAGGNAWIIMMNWPRFGIYDNGEYPFWNKTTYNPGETKEYKCLIEISEQNGMNAKKSPVRFKSLIK